MENTLEVRWFVRGMPPAVVQRWFKFECPGKLLNKLETREDWYVYPAQNYLDRYLDKFKKFSSSRLNREEINLKLRQGNLELKLRQKECGTEVFSHLQQSRCEGKVEQWCKFSEQELKEFNLHTHAILNETKGISVHKKRQQKIEQAVKSELTRLRINKESWWSIAFEMTQNNRNRQTDGYFKGVVKKACQTYNGTQLSTTNSYGYSCWLLELFPDVARVK